MPRANADGGPTPPGRARPGRSLVLPALLALASPSLAEDLAVNAYCPFPVGSPRVMGMAGAFTGVGSGADALLANPAAVVRPDGFSLGRYEFDYMLSFVSQNEGYHSDFGNVGPDLLGSEGVLMGGLGAVVRVNRGERPALGYGLHLLAQSYSFTDGAGYEAEFSLVSPRLTFGRAWGDEEFFLSLALDPPNPSFKYVPPGETEPMEVEYQGISGVPLEAGLLWVPKGRRFQVGARVKGPSESAAVGTLPPLASPLPEKVVFPGEFSVGVAFRLGEPPPENGGRWFGRALIDLDLRGVFPVSGTAGFERFRSPVPLEVLDEPLLQPALGVEIEVYSRVARLWWGTYREPARYADVSGRRHWTGGFRMLLFRLKKLSFHFNMGIDGADRYNVWTTSISTGEARF